MGEMQTGAFHSDTDITQEQLDGRDTHVEQEMGKGHGAPVPSSPGAPLSSTFTCSATLMLSKPHPFGFLWRLYYMGTID